MTNSQEPSSQAPAVKDVTVKNTDVKHTAPKQGSSKNPQAETKNSRPNKRSPSPLIWPVYLLISLTIFFVSAAGIYFWQNLTQQKLEITRLTSGKANNSELISQLNRVFSQQLLQLDQQSRDSSQQLIKLDRQSLYITQKLSELGASSRSDWLLAEAEYLLHLANQRLNLEHDPKSAEAILMAADKVLSENNDPGLLPVRKALANEILSLQQISSLDIESIYVHLSAIITALDKLDENAFLGQHSTLNKQGKTGKNLSLAKTEIDGELQQLWQQIWSDLQQAFVIRRLDQNIEPLMAPEQSYYLKQNLRLMLEQANLALLDQNTRIFQSSLIKASSWLNNYFDTKDERINALLSNIDTLKALDIEQKTPDISTSLRLLKTKIETMYRNHRLGQLSTPDAEHQALMIKELEKKLQEQTK